MSDILPEDVKEDLYQKAMSGFEEGYQHLLALKQLCDSPLLRLGWWQLCLTIVRAEPLPEPDIQNRVVRRLQYLYIDAVLEQAKWRKAVRISLTEMLIGN